jgi:acetolactate synthase-1/3 small subunit
MMRHTISVLVENEFGVLARVAGLFSGRAFNIESLSVAETLVPTVSRITLVTNGDDQVLAQVERQLEKLVPVIKVTDFTETPHVERELVLIKVAADDKTRSELLNIVDVFRAKVVDVSRKSYVVEVTGAEEKINALIELLPEHRVFVGLGRLGPAVTGNVEVGVAALGHHPDRALDEGLVLDVIQALVLLQHPVHPRGHVADVQALVHSGLPRRSLSLPVASVPLPVAPFPQRRTGN